MSPVSHWPDRTVFNFQLFVNTRDPSSESRVLITFSIPKQFLIYFSLLDTLFVSDKSKDSAAFST